MNARKKRPLASKEYSRVSQGSVALVARLRSFMDSKVCGQGGFAAAGRYGGRSAEGHFGRRR